MKLSKTKRPKRNFLIQKLLKSLLKEFEDGSRTCVFPFFQVTRFTCLELLNFSILFGDTSGDYCFLFETFPQSSVSLTRTNKSNIKVFPRLS